MKKKQRKKLKLIKTTHDLPAENQLELILYGKTVLDLRKL